MIASNLLLTIASRCLGKQSTEKSGETWSPILIVKVGTTDGCVEHDFQARGDMGWVS